MSAGTPAAERIAETRPTPILEAGHTSLSAPELEAGLDSERRVVIAHRKTIDAARGDGLLRRFRDRGVEMLTTGELLTQLKARN